MTHDPAAITRFIINELDTHPKSVVAKTAGAFSISRQAVLKRIRKLIEQGDIAATGATKSRKYEIGSNVVFAADVSLTGLEEDVVWRNHVRPALGDLPNNVIRICAYGFTEMLNNAIEHSGSDSVVIR